MKAVLAASAEAAFRAHIEPKFIQQGLLGPEGWTKPVCICDARPGGAFRYARLERMG